MTSLLSLWESVEKRSGGLLDAQIPRRWTICEFRKNQLD
jgi:hypothetical protein